MASAWIVDSGPSARIINRPSAVVKSNPQPTYNPRTVQPSTPSYSYGGWYNNPATGKNQRWFNGTWTDGAEPSSGGGGGFDIPQPDIDAIRREYEPIYQNYDRDEQMVKETEAGQEKLLGENLATAQGSLARNKAEREEYNKQQEESLNKQLQSAYAETVRHMKSLQQQGAVRFGRGSSAGQAVTDISNSEFYRQQGALQRTHLENVGNIQADFRKYLSWHADEEQRLIQDNKNKIFELKSQTRQFLTQIANNRNLTKSEEARMIRGAQEQYRARVADVNNELKRQQMALDMYREKVMVDLDAQLKAATQQRYAVAGNTFAQDVQSDLKGFTDVNTQGNEDRDEGFQYADDSSFLLARNPRYTEDEFENNPYFA